MRRQNNFIPIAIICIVVSVMVYFFAGSPVFNVLSKGVAGVLRPITNLFPDKKVNEEVTKLKEENKNLLSQLVKFKNQEAENKALLDQFQTTYPKSTQLLPARIVGAPAFIPGVHTAESFVIDKGEKEGVKKGQAVVVGNHLIGRVESLGVFGAKVIVTSHPQFSLKVKSTPIKGEITATSSALGLLKGKGNGQMSMENVLLSEEMKSGDIVTTYGDMDEAGFGIPADLVVGNIISVDKKPSAVFQSGEIKSTSRLNDISTVFVILVTQ